MPQFFIPLIPLLVGGASLASTGLGIANELGGSGQPSQPAATPPTAAQNVAAEVAKRSQQANLVNQQIPGLDASTSGSLSGLSDQTFASNAAGLPGTFGQGGVDLNSIMALLGGSNNGPPTNLMSLATGPSITG